MERLVHIVALAFMLVLVTPAEAQRFEPLDDPRFVPAAQASFLRDADRVVGVVGNGVAKAYPVARLKQAQVVNDQVGTEPVLVVYEARSDTTTAFSRRLAGRILTFRPLESSPIQLSDEETGSVWTTYGECIRGTLKGQELEPLTPLPSFWFSWAEFFPKTEIYTGSNN